uniref:head-tail adaptor protein n=1 Tax=Stappia sp. TaxID=1870903 RepID=UPI003BA86578
MTGGGAGGLDRVMRLERPDRIVAVNGETVTQFADEGAHFVALAPASLAERVAGERLGGTATHKARLRAPNPVRAGFRLVDEDERVFRVLGVDDSARRSGFLTCLLEEEA